MGKARIMFLVALLALALFTAACGSSDSSDSASDAPPDEQGQKPSAETKPSAGSPAERTLPETVRLAYKETTAEDTAKVAFKGVGTGLPGPNGERLTMFLSGQGAVNNESGDADITMRMPPVGKIETRMIGDTMYMRFSGTFPGQPPGGKPWMKMDLDELSREQFGASFFQMRGASVAPEEQLGYLRGVSDSVQQLGEEEVRGVPTTHYRATVDLEKAAAEEKDVAVRRAYEKVTEQIGASELPMEVWLDEKDRVRRIKTVTPVPEEPATGGASDGSKVEAQGKMTMVYEYYDFGAPVRVVPPPAARTTDVTDMALQRDPAAWSL